MEYECGADAFAHMFRMHIYLRQQCDIFNQLHKRMADRPPVSGESYPEQTLPDSLKQHAFRHRIRAHVFRKGAGRKNTRRGNFDCSQ